MSHVRREAKEKNRESWYMAYIMDTNDEERAKGKTVEVGQPSACVSCCLLGVPVPVYCGCCCSSNICWRL